MIQEDGYALFRYLRHVALHGLRSGAAMGGDRVIPVQSIWRESAQLPRFEPLHSDLRTDVLVIGGGLAGILCAYMLHVSGVKYALVEAKTICSGVTGNTTAKITAQHGLIYGKLMKQRGTDGARMYLQANQQALAAYRSLCSGMDCDFETKDNYVYSRHDRSRLDRELSALQKLGASARLATGLPLPVDTVGAVCMPDQAQFNPLKFVSAISKNLHIHENTPVIELAPGYARTLHGNIHAERMIIATHFPMLNKHGGYFAKLYQHRSYVLALENAADVRGMYVDEADEGMSFRNCHNLLLMGGGDHRTGKSGGGWRELYSFADRYYPQARPVCQWATQDCMSLDGAPYIGQYARRTPGLYVLTGFNKWGMTGAMVGAMLIRDTLLDRTPDWAEVFLPSRSMLHAQLWINVMESALGLLTPTSPRCPHMGCALKYNSQEHSWDCPCHGSRFSEEGDLIDNPATGNLKRK